MRVVVIQNRVFEAVDETLNQITKMLSESNLQNSDFLVFPEMFTTPYEPKYIEKNKQYLDSKEINFLKEQAIKYNSYVIGGSVPYFKEGKIFNTCFILDRRGRIIKQYDKIHLFEVTYPNGKHYKESDTFASNKEIGIFDTEFGKFGVMICFDIRFPELAEKLMKAGAKAIFVPAAFNTFTGPLHWQVTFRARAIDNQCFFIGCSPSANSYGKYKVYGHSIITNPLGKIESELDSAPGLIIKDVNLLEVEKARKVIPIIENKLDWSK